MDRVWRWIVAVMVSASLYVLSSGPVLAVAFWLREKTHFDGFYLVLWLYYPVLKWDRHYLIREYIEWWVNAVGTVGPG